VRTQNHDKSSKEDAEKIAKNKLCDALNKLPASKTKSNRAKTRNQEKKQSLCPSPRHRHLSAGAARPHTCTRPGLPEPVGTRVAGDRLGSGSAADAAGDRGGSWEQERSGERTRDRIDGDGGAARTAGLGDVVSCRVRCEV
jgi:hypothetical protein